MNMKDIILVTIHFIQAMMNFMVLSRRVTVQGPVTLYSGPFGVLWGTPRSNLEMESVVQKVDYLYNNTIYTYVARSMTPMWPREETPREMGFRPAIKRAEAVIKENRKRDVTLEIKRLAGPRGDWHRCRFSPRDVFGVDCSTVVLTDVLGGTRRVDADEAFYASSESGPASEAK